MGKFLYSTVEEANEEFQRVMRRRWIRDPQSLHVSSYQIREVQKALSRGKILVGYHDRYYQTEPYYLDYTGERICCLVSGGSAGAGKSVFGGNVVIDECDGFELNRFVVDPKNEFHFRKYPAESFTETLESMNPPKSPKGHENMITVSPNILPNNKSDLTTFFTNNELNRYDLLTLLAIDETTTDGSYLASQVDQLLYGEGFDKALESGDIEMMAKSNLNAKLPPFSKIYKDANTQLKGVKIARGLKNLLSTQAVLDEEWGKKNINIIDLMNQGKIVVLNTSDNPDLQRILSAYVSFYLRRISQARENHIKNLSGDKLRKPVICYLGEFQTYMGKHNYSSSVEIIKQIYDVYRYRNISIFGEAPSFTEVHPVALRQSDYVFSFRPTLKEDSALKERGIDTNQLWRMRELLEFDRFNPPNPMMVLPLGLDLEADMRELVIYPLPPQSAIQMEQRVKQK